MGHSGQFWQNMVHWRSKWKTTSVSMLWASLIAQLVKNPAMQETGVWSLGWEDPLEKGKATHSSGLVWRIPSPQGCRESDTTKQLSLSLSHSCCENPMNTIKWQKKKKKKERKWNTLSFLYISPLESPWEFVWCV